MSKLKWTRAAAASRVAREAKQRQITAPPKPKPGPVAKEPNRFAFASGAAPAEKARITLARFSIQEKGK